MRSIPATTRSDEGSNLKFPIVGIGASAGGLEAFSQLLDRLPTNTGMAFVLIQHLDPTHPSMLRELLAKTTAMPVIEIGDGLEVAPDRVYVLPPNAGTILAGNTLKLVPRERIGGRSLPIDLFFNSLAAQPHHQAIAVVLSGTDGDGAVGLAAVKASGGQTFAQDPATAKFRGMPDRAISTGCVDFILSPAAIAQRLGEIGANGDLADLRSPPSANSSPISYEQTLATIFPFLKQTKGLDFTGYKPTTLKRRLARRMALHNFTTVENYVDYLQVNPSEVDELCQDLLINVTSFFRDLFVFDALKKRVFPAIVQSKSIGSSIRIWVAACSTGEEVYSLAIALVEYLEECNICVPIQIFATDISENAIDIARAGIYKQSQMKGVSLERLQRFFVKIENGYQIGKSVRELCVFAKQNLIADPPFSQLDLISCRNVLIYLGAELQKWLMPIFHYALKPNGCLILGTSETIGEFTDLFESIDKKSRIYGRKSAQRRHYLRFNSSNLSLATVTPLMPIDEDNRHDLDLHQEADRIVLNRYAPVGVVIDEEMDIVQFRGQTGTYLEPAAGKPSFNLFKMLKPDLLVKVRATVHQAKQQNEIVRQSALQIKTPAGTHTFNLEVVPFTSADRRYFLVLFEASEIATTAPLTPANSSRSRAKKTELERENQRLQQELAATRAYLQSIVEEQESTDRAFQVANEEILSSNEELQSTNEELETSQEELQATNEELQTINEELNSRNAELSQIDNDLQNLLSSINISILMLDGELNIRRFTSLAQQFFNLIPTDLGRPFSDIQPNLLLPDLSSSIQATIDTLVTQEQEVQDRQGHWYSLRIRPYRTLENRIDGAVIGLIDIDTLKRNTVQLEAARDYANAIFETVRQPSIVLAADFRVIRANQYFYQLFDLSPAQIERQSIFELEHGMWDLPALRSQLATILTENREFQDFEMTQPRANRADRLLLLNACQIIDDREEISILLAIEDITERRQAEAQIQASLVEKEVLLREIHHRVTNNLQIISSLLSLQSNRLDDVRSIEILRDSQNRVRTMAAIHEILYRSSNLAALNFTQYIQTLVDNLFESYTIDRAAIAQSVVVTAGVTINVDRAVLCGLIINELVANAIEHGFAGGASGTIAIEITIVNENFLSLSVANNGRSLPADFDITTVRSMGLNLVLSLINQIEGNLEIETGETTIFKIILPIKV